MQRPLLILGLLAALSEPAPAAVKGFVVFSPTGTQSYEFAPDRSLRLTASGPARDPKNHVACAGRVFGVEPLLGRIYRLGPDLKEDRSIDLGKIRDVARLVGADDDRLYVFFNNTLAAFDAELRPAGRVKLDPGKVGEIVPVVTVDECQVFAGNAYLLAGNTGDVFAVDLKIWTVLRVPLAREGPAGATRLQWIDPMERTLNVLVSREREEHTPDLEDAESRVIKTEVVLTFALAGLRQPPRETLLREEREIYKPYPPGFLEGIERQNAQGIIVDYPPPYRQERPPRGVYISKVSATVPCFAEVIVEEENQPAVLGSRKIVVLGSGGKTTGIERFRDEKHDVVWFKHGGEVRILAPEIRKRQLNIQSSAYLKLLELPGTADAAVFAY